MSLSSSDIKLLDRYVGSKEGLVLLGVSLTTPFQNLMEDCGKTNMERRLALTLERVRYVLSRGVDPILSCGTTFSQVESQLSSLCPICGSKSGPHAGDPECIAAQVICE